MYSYRHHKSITNKVKDRKSGCSFPKLSRYVVNHDMPNPRVSWNSLRYRAQIVYLMNAFKKFSEVKTFQPMELLQCMGTLYTDLQFQGFPLRLNIFLI